MFRTTARKDFWEGREDLRGWGVLERGREGG